MKLLVPIKEKEIGGFIEGRRRTGVDDKEEEEQEEEEIIL
jgi:hypothetical protein